MWYLSTICHFHGVYYHQLGPELCYKMILTHWSPDKYIYIYMPWHKHGESHKIQNFQLYLVIKPIDSLALGGYSSDFKNIRFSISSFRAISWALTVRLLSCECHRISLMTSQHGFWKWLGAIRQKAITWANVDPDVYCHMVSLGLSELKFLLYICIGSHWWYISIGSGSGLVQIR